MGKKKSRKYGRQSARKVQRSSRKQGSSIPGWIWLLAGGTGLILLTIGLAFRPNNNSQAGVALAAPEVLAQGEVIYSETCAACHGPEGEGDVGPALNGSMHSWHHMDNQIRSVILDGRPGTPMVGHRGHLTDEEVEAVISYFKAWWTPEQRAMQLTGQHPMPSQ
jgi:mono/diheme cytochrome c family protein